MVGAQEMDSSEIDRVNFPNHLTILDFDLCVHQFGNVLFDRHGVATRVVGRQYDPVHQRSPHMAITGKKEIYAWWRGRTLPGR